MSTIKVNTITTRSGSTITLGESGKTITLACGASQSGFGRTGTVDWCTTAKTSPFTAVSGDGFFVNTTGGAITVTLPSSPSAGDIISLKDYANTWDTNNVTLARNGSKINGQCSCALLDTESQSVTLIYVDGTKGWQSIQDGTSNVSGAAFIAATGGTIATSGDYKIHTFTSDSNFVVTCRGNSAGSNKVSYLVVAGGGGSGRYYGGGGGGGGYREGKAPAFDSYSASPLVAPDGLTVTDATYPITVGGGGATGNGSPPYSAGVSGGNSVFSTITSAGGGGGAGGHTTHDPAKDGGSGGGGHYPSPASSGSETGGAGNTPPVSPPQGTPGVTTPVPAWAGAGGGATATGSIRVGGAGATSSINGTPTGRAGGGAGGPCSGVGSPQAGAAAASPCGSGANYNTSATANTGGGGGSDGGAGGSGIVIIRYKFQ